MTSTKQPISKQGVNYLDINSVICFETTKTSTKIYLCNDQKEYISMSINEIEKVLSLKNFIRVHHSYLINANKIIKYVTGNGGYLDLGIGFKVPVSISKKINLILYFNELNMI